MARATGQAHYERAARGFALHAAEHWRELYDVPDRPASLFEVRGAAGGARGPTPDECHSSMQGLCTAAQGVAGAVNFWLAVVDHPQHAAWPGAEL